MKGINRHILSTALIIASSSAFAAKPTSIKYIEDIVLDNDLIFSYYQVKCSNGKTSDITAWNNRKKWCVGKGQQDKCYKKQIKTAKKVCR